MPNAYSCRFVFPMMIAPAARSLATWVASSGAWKCSSASDPFEVGMSIAEPELVVRPSACMVPRLIQVPRLSESVGPRSHADAAHQLHGRPSMLPALC